MLNLTPQGEGISFNKGEILPGLVQAVREDGMVMLFIKGKLIEAASEILVKSGQQLYLMVDEYRDGRTYLKVVTTSMMGDIEKANLAASLRNLGLTASQENVQMARKLLDYNLPVTASNLNHLSRGIKMLGEFSPPNLGIAAFAMSKDIVTSPVSLNALAQFASSRNEDVARIFNDLWQMLKLVETGEPVPGTGKASTVVSPLQNAGTNPAAAGVISEQAATVPPGQIILSNAPVAGENSNHPQTGVAGRTPDEVFPGTNPSVIEESARANVSLTNNAGTERSASSDFAGTRGVSPAASLNLAPERNWSEILILAARLLETMLLKNELPAQENAARLANMVKTEPYLLKSLQILVDLIKNNQTEKPNPMWTELATQLEGLGKEIIGQKLFNLAARMPGENMINGYYFTFPVQLGNELRLCQLKIQRETKRPLHLLDRIRFIVSLDTRNLGVVLFYVDWQRSSELNLQGVVENEAAWQQISRNISSLTARLEDLGYRVSLQGLKIARRDDIINLRPQLEEKPESVIRPLSIDVTV